MKTWVAPIGVLAGGALMAAVLLVGRGTPPSIAARTPMAPFPVDVQPTEQQRIEVSNSKLIEPINYAQVLKQSRNYLEFVRSVMSAAKSGDEEAQYTLGKALAFCDETYSIYFQRKGQPLTLDEGLGYAAQLHRSNQVFLQLSRYVLS